MGITIERKDAIMPRFIKETIVTVQKGTKVVHKFLVVECGKLTTYSMQVGDLKNAELFRAITEEEYNKMIQNAEADGCFVWRKGK